MKKNKNYIIPVICVFLISSIIYSGYKVWEILSYDNNIIPESDYVSTESKEIIIPTISNTNYIIRPYNDSNVKAEIPFYNQDGTDKEQQSALIYYENIYMQNTGVMYTSDDTFNCVSVMDGKIKDIKDDQIMGKIVEIENNKNITTIYQSLSEVNVKVGDIVKQGDVIGVSGKNEITGNEKQALHFEVYNKGNIIDPEQFYLLSQEDLND